VFASGIEMSFGFLGEAAVEPKEHGEAPLTALDLVR